MGIATCPECGRNLWNWRDNCMCGYSFKNNLISIKRNINVETVIDPIITWSRKATKKQIEEGASDRITYYHNCTTGNQSTLLADVMTDRGFKLIERKGKFKKGIFVTEDTENNMLVFVMCNLNTTPPLNGEIREWQEACRMYLTKEKDLYFEPITWENLGSFWREKPLFTDKFLKKKFQLLNVSFDITKAEYINEVDNSSWDDFNERIKNFIPETKIVKLSGNKMLHVKDPISFAEYFKKKESTKVRSGPKQAKIDELTAIELSKVEKPENVVEAIEDGVRYCKVGTNVDTFATLEAVPGLEKTCVLRTFSSIAGDDTSIQEGYRMYVQGKNVYVCKVNFDGKFVYTPLFNNAANWNFALNDFDAEVTKGTILEYFGSVINDIDVNARSKAIWAFIKWPVFEQLSKAGYISITNWVLNNCVEKNPEELLSFIFSSNLEGKNLYAKLGVNKFQLDYVNENINSFRSIRTEWYDRGLFSAINFVKFIMDEDNNDTNPRNYWYRRQPANFLNPINNLDNETFVKYVDAYIECLDKLSIPRYVENQISYTSYNSEDFRNNSIENYNQSNAVRKLGMMMICLSYIRKMYSPITALNMLENLTEIIDQRIKEVRTYYGGRTYEYYSEPLELYRDYLVMVSQIDDTKNLRAQFRNIEHIKDMHDSIALIVQINKDKIVLESFKNRAKSCSKWEYKEDDYIVIAPKLPEELAKEGNELHHCVKSYIDRVANGITNIMFIRKAEEADVPFFTVEVSNNGSIEQIHGLCNRNLETEPALEPFVKRWIKNCKLRSNGFNKVR